MPKIINQKKKMKDSHKQRPNPDAYIKYIKIINFKFFLLKYPANLQQHLERKIKQLLLATQPKPLPSNHPFLKPYELYQ